MTTDGSPSGTTVPPADGSAIPASGTTDGAAGGSGVDQAAEIERLRAENERKDNIIAQHLSEKTNTERSRRQAEEERAGLADEARMRAQFARDQAVLANPAAYSDEEFRGATARMVGGMSAVISRQSDEIRRLKETQREVPAPAEVKLPAEVRSRAKELVDSGYAVTMEDGIDKAIGEAVRQGKWTPHPEPAPASPAPAPAAASRPQPAASAQPRPVATVTRSVPSSQAGPGAVTSMTKAEYMALTGPAFDEAYRRRREGSLTVT